MKDWIMVGGKKVVSGDRVYAKSSAGNKKRPSYTVFEVFGGPVGPQALCSLDEWPYRMVQFKAEDLERICYEA